MQGEERERGLEGLEYRRDCHSKIRSGGEMRGKSRGERKKKWGKKHRDNQDSNVLV